MITNNKVISIITATYNAELYLEKLILSIIPQKNDEIEFIIIDGGSTDNTLNTILKHIKYVDYWESKPDKGIYDAWNKGIQIAKGDWIMFLGADDILLPGALDSYSSYIKSHKSDILNIISSKLDYVDKKGKHLKYLGEPWNWNKYKKRKFSFAHPGLLHKKDLFIEYGSFDLSSKICADSDFFLRVGPYIKGGYLDEVTVKMQAGGMSYSFTAIIESFKNRKKNKSLPLHQNIAGFIALTLKYSISTLKQKLGHLFLFHNL